MKEQLRFQNLGLIEYEQAYILQKKYVEEVRGGAEPIILLCEHPTVLTLGRMSNVQHILASDQCLKDKGIEVKTIDRGGDITLHALGQLVIYPILNLSHFKKDLHLYLRSLEGIVIDLLKEFDVAADRVLGKTGAWVGKNKIASIGIGVRRWISYHGIAINVNTDLSLFSLIKPCGLDVQMTSISNIKGCQIDMDQVKEKIMTIFLNNFLGKESYV